MQRDESDCKFLVTCPFCGIDIELTADHAMKNDLACCMSCNKAFSISISDIEITKQNKRGENEY